jgi:excisionase family DNA binding protein
MASAQEISDMLTIREVARIFHVHPNTLRRWSNNGIVRAYRINTRGDRRYKREEIVRFLDDLNGHGNGDREA